MTSPDNKQIRAARRRSSHRDQDASPRRGRARGDRARDSRSYLVDILRYPVHLVGPGHPAGLTGPVQWVRAPGGSGGLLGVPVG